MGYGEDCGVLDVEGYLWMLAGIREDIEGLLKVARVVIV